MTSPIVNGDAGLVLKADGTFVIFTTSEESNEADITPIQQVQSLKLMALSAALSNADIMDSLISLVEEAGISSPQSLNTVQ